MPDLFADKMTFGIEIECFFKREVIDDLGIRVGRYHAGIQLPDPFPDGWNAQADGSLNRSSGADWRDMAGFEIVSPILQGLDGLDQIYKVGQILQQHGVRVNRSCGVHVHVGATPLFPDWDYNDVATWVQKLIKLVSQHENALYAIGGQVLRMRSYNGSMKEYWEPAELEGRKTMHELAGMAGIRIRRQTLNFNHIFDRYGRKRTVEFRIFAATTHPAKLVGYAMTAMGLCQRAYEMNRTKAFYKDPKVRSGSWEEEVALLHRTLNWVRGYYATTHPQGHKRGAPTGSWAKYKKLVTKNQQWNAKSFAERAPAELTE